MKKDLNKRCLDICIAVWTIHCLDLPLSSTRVDGKIYLRPEHNVTTAGVKVYYICSSSIPFAPLFWHWSGARQTAIQLVYNGTLSKDMSDRFEVTQESVNGNNRSILTVKKTSLRDAGALICEERMPKGEIVQANLSVIDELSCKSYCDADSLLISCWYRYLGENNLVPYVSTPVNEDSSTLIPVPKTWQDYSKGDLNITQTFLVELGISCSLAIRYGITVTIKDEFTRASSKAFNRPVISVTKSDEKKDCSCKDVASRDGNHDELYCRGSLSPCMILLICIILLSGILITVVCLKRFQRCNGRNSADSTTSKLLSSSAIKPVGGS